MTTILPGPGTIPTIGRIPTDQASVFQLAAALDAVYGQRSLAAVVLITHNHELGELIRAARLTLHEAGIHEIQTRITSEPEAPKDTGDTNST